MQLDMEKYRPFVDHFDMSEEAELELVRTVSDMMRAFVDLAFGETPEQQLLGIDWEKIAFEDSGELCSADPVTPEFNQAADGEAQERESP